MKMKYIVTRIMNEAHGGDNDNDDAKVEDIDDLEKDDAKIDNDDNDDDNEGNDDDNEDGDDDESRES